MPTPVSTSSLGVCRSNIHTTPVPATYVGVFDCSMLNGAKPELDSQYCTRCAAALVDVGYFTPYKGQPPVPALANVVATDNLM